MPVYQVTYKNGCQQFMEMDIEEAGQLTDQMDDYACWEDNGRPNDGGYPHHRIYSSSTGVTVDVSTIAGFQHYISKGYAEQRANEDGGTADFNDAIDAAIQAMIDTAEVEGSEPNAYVAAIDKRAVLAAFLNTLGRNS